MQFSQRKAKENRHESLMAAKAKMEQHPVMGKLIREWWQFEALGIDEVNRRSRAWTHYYQSIRSGKAFALYMEQRDLLKKMSRASLELQKELIEQIKQNGLRARVMMQEDADTIPKPPFRDPYEFYHSEIIVNYKALLKGIERENPKSEFMNNLQGYLS